MGLFPRPNPDRALVVPITGSPDTAGEPRRPWHFPARGHPPGIRGSGQQHASDQPKMILNLPWQFSGESPGRSEHCSWAERQEEVMREEGEGELLKVQCAQAVKPR